jgi:Protein of unknown function (DUF559)
MAALLACGPGALLSHGSAATLHGLVMGAQVTIDVTISHRAGLARPGIQVHRPRRLFPEDHASLDGISCTSVPRTLLDLATVLNPRLLERACERAETLRLLDWSSMAQTLRRARGRPGVRRLRTALGARDGKHAVTRSELERRFLAVCRLGGLPSPATNQWLTVACEEMQVDFVWHRSRVIVETDGYSTHRTRQAFARDRRRDQLLATNGWRVVRFTWEEVTQEPRHVAEVVRKLLLKVT